MKRTTARQIAVQLGFAVCVTGEEPDEAIGAFFAPEHYVTLADENELYKERPDDKSLLFIRRSVRGVYDRRIELDGLIARYAKGWRPERISRSAAAVLRQAMFEILCMPDVPPAAAMDEAVELAKGYEDEDVVSFVNGVLGGFYRVEVLGEEPKPDVKAETEAEVEVEAEAEAETETETEAEAEVEPDVEAEAEVETEADPDVEVEIYEEPETREPDHG